jgi:hypothetical protein
MPVLLSLLPANSPWNGCLISFEWLFLPAQTICHYHVVKRALHKTKEGGGVELVGAKYQFDSPLLHRIHLYYRKTKHLPRSNIGSLQPTVSVFIGVCFFSSVEQKCEIICIFNPMFLEN